MKSAFLTASAFAILPASVWAQNPPVQPTPSAPTVNEDEGEEIVVTGQRQRGAVVGDIKPELQLNAGDVRALGVSNIGDLLTELGPQLQSGRGGTPVVLLEGRRIAGFREIATIPAEAIARVDILPEEVALKYGYSADQKVMNIVLRQRFRAISGEIGTRIVTDGGGARGQGEADLLTINRGGRLNLHAETTTTSPITEAQRGIGLTDNSGFYRTLAPDQQTFTMKALLAKNLPDTVQLTLSGQIDTSDSVRTFGLQSAALTLPANSPYNMTAAPVALTRNFDTQSPLSADSSTISAAAGLTLSGSIDKWQWNFTGTYDHDEAKTLTGRGFDTTAFQAAVAAGVAGLDPRGAIPLAYVNGNPADRANSRSDVGQLNYTMSGSPLRLPAGEANLTARIGAQLSGFSSDSVRSGVAAGSDVSRQVGDAQVNLDLPITSRRSGVLSAIGDFSINGNATVRRLSDFGWQRTYGYGLTWAPAPRLAINASHIDDDGAPTPQQLGNPVITVPNVRTFDFVTGNQVNVTQVTGGNPFLRASNRRSDRIGANWTPLEKTQLNLSVDFTRERVTDPITSLPPVTLASQLAFPDRYQRDGAGNLFRIDTRTVNLAETERSQIRWGFNFSKPLKQSQAAQDALRAAFQKARESGMRPTSVFGGQGGPGGPGGPDGGRPPGAGGGPRTGGGGGGRAGGGFGGPNGPGAGRLSLSVYHTVHLTDRATLVSGQAPIDLLRGGTLGSGGQPRHEVEVQAGYSKAALGFRATANWQSSTRVSGGSGPTADDLSFGSLTTVGLRVFASAPPTLALKHPWLRGTRVQLMIDNVFNDRQRVTDGTGITPIAYQPGYIDPLGRTIRITLRKLLF